MWKEPPFVRQIAKRPFCIFNINFKMFLIELNVRCKALAKHLETDDQIRRQRGIALLADARRHAPWQEFRIPPHISDKRIKLFRPMRDHPLFSMDGHL